MEPQSSTVFFCGRGVVSGAISRLGVSPFVGESVDGEPRRATHEKAGRKSPRTVCHITSIGLRVKPFANSQSARPRAMLSSKLLKATRSRGLATGARAYLPSFSTVALGATVAVVGRAAARTRAGTGGGESTRASSRASGRVDARAPRRRGSAASRRQGRNAPRPERRSRGSSERR